jgi:demethylmenaquinone methyltransferase/2-methoxy-6-polyprenyl-1,4-benzoquinol methylase
LRADGSRQPERTSAPEAEPYTRALERMNRFQEPEGRTAIADLGLPRGSRGLDVGCGVGLYALWLAEAVGPDGHVTGIEPSAERVEAARALVSGALPSGRLDFRQGDGTAIDAPDGTFDWLWCGDVLHHIQETAVALKEFARVVRPGGLILIKESQLLSALFLPGHPELERRLQRAETEWSRAEAGAHTFQERRQRTPRALREAGLAAARFHTYVVKRQAPLGEEARGYIQHVVFERNWGPRLRELLAPEDWAQRSALCEADSPDFVLASPDYYCLYPISVFAARRPG